MPLGQETNQQYFTASSLSKWHIGQIGQTIGTAYVRQVSCWTTFILIQQNKMPNS